MGSKSSDFRPVVARWRAVAWRAGARAWLAPVGRGAAGSRHVDAERAARILVDDVRDRHGGDHLDEVGRDAAVEPAEALTLHDVAEHAVHCTLCYFRGFLCGTNEEVRHDHCGAVHSLPGTMTNSKPTPHPNDIC